MRGVWFSVLCLAAAAFAARAPVDVQSIVQRSVAANDADFRAQPQYSYDVREAGPDGVKTYEVRMILGSDYRKLIAENGEPLSPEEQKKEERKLADEIAKRRAESPADRRDRIAKYERDRRRDHAMMQELTKAFNFRLLGTQKLGAFQCYVLRATPRPGYQPPNRDTEVLPGMEGRMWIDTKTFQWVKVEARVVHPVSIEGFLAEVEPGTRFELEKMPVGDGIWLPKHFAMRSDARILHLFSKKDHEDDTFFDYRKGGPVQADGR